LSNIRTYALVYMHISSVVSNKTNILVWKWEELLSPHYSIFTSYYEKVDSMGLLILLKAKH